MSTPPSETKTNSEPYIVQTEDGFCAWVGVDVSAVFDLTQIADYERLNLSERLDQAVRNQQAYCEHLLAIADDEIVSLRFTGTGRGRTIVTLLGRTVAGSEQFVTSRSTDLLRRLSAVPPHLAVTQIRSLQELRNRLSPFEPDPQGLMQIGKRVRVQGTSRPDAGVSSYLSVEPFSRGRADQRELFDLLALSQNEISITITLSPLEVPGPAIATLEHVTTRLAELAQPFDALGELGGRIRYPGDAAAATLLPIFRDSLSRYRGRVFRFCITIASSERLDPAFTARLAGILSPSTEQGTTGSVGGEIPAGSATFTPKDSAQYALVRSTFLELTIANLQDTQLNSILVRDADRSRGGLAILREIVDGREAASLFRLPIAVDGALPGIAVRRPPDRLQTLDAVTGQNLMLGSQAGGHDADDVRIATKDLVRHSFIVGTPGSGKTNTALHLCRQLWAQEVPFLVIEPINSALNDYRWLATLDEFADLVIFTVGDESTAPFRLNPFQVPNGVTTGAHISNILSCFEAAFGLWDPLPFIYRRALVLCYRRRGFHSDIRGSQQHLGSWPTLSEFVGALTEVVKSLDYRGDVGANIDAAARLRAESLAEGSCGATLDCVQSFDMKDLLRRPVVVELAGIGDNSKEQALFTLLLLNAARSEYRESRPFSDEMHATFIEEAHRIFPGSMRKNGDEKEADARSLAAERIAQALAEDRKYREAFILIDQQVGKVSDDAYKITNLKVLHRTASEEDRRLLGATMSTHSDQIDSAAGLRPFQALVSHNNIDRAVTIDVPNVRQEDAARRGTAVAPLADDVEIRRRHLAYTASETGNAAMAPFSECTDCRSRCKYRARSAGIIALSPEAARGLFPANGGAAEAMEGIKRLSSSPMEIDETACLFIHAFRSVYPPETWTDAGRRNAVEWVANVRAQMVRHRSAES